MTGTQDPKPSGDNPGLSPGRRYRDTPDVVEGVLRQMRAVAKRIGREDPVDLLLLRALELELAELWELAIAGQRRSGFSDSEIAEKLGVSKQAVQKRLSWHDRR